jgi:hypothetical protein
MPVLEEPIESTATAPAPKAEPKKAAPKKTTEPKKPAPKKHAVDPAPKKAGDKAKKEGTGRKSSSYADADREKAKNLGLRLSQFKVLQFLCNSPEKSPPRTYADIKGGTGYYQSLTADCRAGKEDSLCDKGYAKEFMIDVDGRQVVAFAATAKGRQAVAKLK